MVNPSDKSRIWNVKLDAGDIIGTNLTQEDSREGIEAGQSWDIDFSLEEIKPILKLTEVINANADASEIDPFFVYNGKDTCAITISLENQIGVPIQNVTVTKVLPKFLKLLEVAETTGGNANLDRDSGILTWEINPIDAGQTVSCTVKGQTNIEDTEEKEGEKIEVKYEAPGAKHSQLSPQVLALTDTMNGVEKSEGSQPGTWDCEAELVNESTFDITLKKVEIENPIATGSEKVVDLEPNEVVQSEQSWKYKFTMESESVPQLNPVFDFTTNFIVETKIIGTQVKESTKYSVLRAEVEKVIEPPTVDAYANTDMNITVNVSNEGTAPVDSLKITDEIPLDFEMPTVEQIMVKITGGADERELSTDNLAVSIDDRVITIDTFSLATEGILKMPPGAKMVVTYPIIARAPKPNTPYPTPVKISANTLVKGTPYEAVPTTAPEIGIRYVKRAIKTMKSVSPGANEGEFNVKVRLTNGGDVELENIQVKELMPEGFRITDYLPKEFVPQEVEGPGLLWNIPRIDANDSLTISYSVEGSGEYPRTEPEVVVDAGVSAAKKEASASASAEMEGEAPSIAGKKGAATAELFSSLTTAVQGVMPTRDVIAELENFRDGLGSIGMASPVMHDIGAFVQSMKKWDQNKPVVGGKLEDVMNKISEWREKLIGE
ncbi:MAG TPA: hypothetical protein VKK79_11400 [Candidatus Lokiarchaeia archaeon]|nr:hypothetical protein [Candidatus Lokiarchaeia archaeon]